MNKKDSLKNINNKYFNSNQGFGLVDAIVSMTLLTGVITYGIYFSSIRLSTVFRSNLSTSINKEIERDIERLKSDFWGLYFEESENCLGRYCSSDGKPLSLNICSDFTQDIVGLQSWNVEEKSSNMKIQSWIPGPEKSKVFSGEAVKISRELIIKSPLENENLNKTIASISYRVEWAENNIHWLSISLTPEAHSWCENII